MFTSGKYIMHARKFFWSKWSVVCHVLKTFEARLSLIISVFLNFAQFFFSLKFWGTFVGGIFSSEGSKNSFSKELSWAQNFWRKKGVKNKGQLVRYYKRNLTWERSNISTLCWTKHLPRKKAKNSPYLFSKYVVKS